MVYPELEHFFKEELQDKQMYLDIVSFVESPHIRCGEFECNSHVIRKKDHDHFEIWLEECLEDYLSNQKHACKIGRIPFLRTLEEEAKKRCFIS